MDIKSPFEIVIRDTVGWERKDGESIDATRRRIELIATLKQFTTISQKMHDIIDNDQALKDLKILQNPSSPECIAYQEERRVELVSLKKLEEDEKSLMKEVDALMENGDDLNTRLLSERRSAITSERIRLQACIQRRENALEKLKRSLKK